MNSEEINALVELHLKIWNQKDEGKRKTAIEDAYSETILVTDPFLEFTGQSKLDNLINDLHQKYPGYVFTHQRPVESHHNIARLFWHFGPPLKPDAIIGEDVFVIKNGKIEHLLVFIDGQSN
jgi:hypothetical protein